MIDSQLMCHSGVVSCAIKVFQLKTRVEAFMLQEQKQD